MGIPFAELSGTPYEIGFAHGSAFRAQVAASLSCYRHMFADYAGLEWARACELAGRWLSSIEAYEPRYVEEMRGLAEGAGVAFEEILVLNCRSELVFVGAEADKADGGCTAIGVAAERARGGNVLLAQNWDWKSTQRDAMVALRIRQQGVPDVLMVTEAGIIGKVGMNAEGVGVCLNALSTDRVPQGLPLHIALRGVLESATIADAIAAATRMPLGCCANFMIAHGTGEVVDIELDGDDFDVLYPTDGLCVHANHFVSPRLPRVGERDTLKFKVPDTFIRRGRAEKLLRGVSGPINASDVKRVLCDHAEWPSAICRHDDVTKPEGLRMATVFSLIMDVSCRRMLLCFGSPCEQDYQELEL
ncbi:MAG: C45 family peptidase [Eggerthellaceae bacterium]|nr:C45 family peptidase [Eggerthellaceae bacterium]